MDKKNSSSQKQNSRDRNRSSNRPLVTSLVPREASGNNQNQREMPVNQPRQPANLQDLLRYAVEANQEQAASNNSSFQAMDEDRKRFLNEAITSLTVNVIEEIQKDVKKLQNVIELGNEDDPSEYIAALERICEYADNMDVANDFYKIGGFSIFGSCLNSPHEGIRSKAAELIAELTQNNPFCQERIVEAGFVPILLGMIDSDPCNLARIKSLYAVSCIVRGHVAGLDQLEKNDGYSILMRALQSSVEKLQIKSAFLLSFLCSKDSENKLKHILVKMGLIEQAAGLLTMGTLSSDTKEQLLAMLNGLTSNNFLPSLIECRRPELCLKQTLEKHLTESKKDESIEIEDICKELLDKLFLEHEADQER